MKIRNKLIATLVTLFIIFTIFSSIFMYYIDSKVLLESAGNELIKETNSALLKIDLFMLEKYKDVIELSDNPILKNEMSSQEEITSELLRYKLRDKDIISISFFDKNRIRLADTNGYNIGEQHKIIGYWNDVLKGKVSSGNDIRISKAAGNKLVIFFASPVRNNKGGIIGYVNTKIYKEALQKLFGNIKVEETHVYLLTPNGSVIYSNEGAFGNKIDYYLPDSYNKAKQGKKGIIIERLTQHHNNEFMSVFNSENGYASFKGNGWILIFSEELSYIMSPITNLGRQLFVINIIFLALSIGAIILLIKKLTNPIEHLSKTMKDIIQTKNLNQKIEIFSNDEIGALGRRFQEMIRMLKETTYNSKELNKQIKNKTNEIQSKVDELARFNKLTVGRELKMIELKEKNKELAKKLINK